MAGKKGKPPAQLQTDPALKCSKCCKECASQIGLKSEDSLQTIGLTRLQSPLSCLTDSCQPTNQPYSFNSSLRNNIPSPSDSHGALKCTTYLLSVQLVTWFTDGFVGPQTSLRNTNNVTIHGEKSAPIIHGYATSILHHSAHLLDLLQLVSRFPHLFFKSILEPYTDIYQSVRDSLSA